MDSNSDRAPLLKYEYDTETPPSVAVIRAVATLEEVNPTALAGKHGQTLFNHVDPDGFNTLVRNGTETTNLEIEFTIYGYRIHIEEPTCVLVYDHEE